MAPDVFSPHNDTSTDEVSSADIPANEIMFNSLSDDLEDEGIYQDNNSGYQLLEDSVDNGHHSRCSDEEEDGSSDDNESSDEDSLTNESAGNVNNNNGNTVSSSIPDLGRLANYLPQPINDCEEYDDYEDRSRTFGMDQDRIETIKSVMKGFALPSSSIPAWASEISDDQWQNMIDCKIHSARK